MADLIITDVVLEIHNDSILPNDIFDEINKKYIIFDLQLDYMSGNNSLDFIIRHCFPWFSCLSGFGFVFSSITQSCNYIERVSKHFQMVFIIPERQVTSSKITWPLNMWYGAYGNYTLDHLELLQLLSFHHWFFSSSFYNDLLFNLKNQPSRKQAYENNVVNPINIWISIFINTRSPDDVRVSEASRKLCYIIIKYHFGLFDFLNWNNY